MQQHELVSRAGLELTRRDALKAIGTFSLAALISACAPSNRSTSTIGSTAVGSATTLGPATTLAAIAGGIIRVDMTTDPNILDTFENEGPSLQLIEGLYANRLLRWDYETFDMVPDVAASLPELTNDFTTVTVTLRDGVTWHNGDALTAEDVRFTYIDVLVNDLEHRSVVPWLQSVDVLDDLTVVFNLKERYPLFPELLTVWPLLNSNLGYVLDETYANTLVGTGPFKLASYEPGVVVRFERNSDYFDGPPELDGVELHVVPEDETRIANIGNGVSHIMPHVPYDRIEAIESTGASVINVPRSQQPSTMLFNHDPETPGGRVGGDVNFRRAITWALDRQTIIDVVYAGRGIISSTYNRPGTRYHDDALGQTFSTAPDVAKATEFLEQSSVDLSQSFGLYVFNTPRVVEIATIVQANLADVGITIDLLITDPGPFVARYDDPEYVFSIFDQGLRPSYPAVGEGYTGLLSGNRSRYEDPVMQDLILTALRADPGTASEEAWRAVQAHEVDVVPHVHVVIAEYIEAVSPLVGGYEVSPGDIWGIRRASLTG